MRNYIIPYVIKVIQNEYLVIKIEEKLLGICKNSKYRKVFEEMRQCDSNHLSIFNDYLIKRNYNVHEMESGTIKYLNRTSDCIKCLLGLKHEVIEIYKYLNFVSTGDINPLFIQRIIRTEIYSIDILKQINKSIKSCPYFTTPVIDLITSFKYYYLTLYYLKMSLSNEEDAICCQSLQSIVESLEEQLVALFDIIQSYTNYELKVHKITQNDTMWTISKQYECSVEEIVNLNSITNPYDLEKDKILFIPLKSNQEESVNT